MDKYSELYRKIVLEGNYKGIRFEDARYFLEKTGFTCRNNGGDHFRYAMKGVPELINLQPDKNDHKMAKDYQMKQVRNLFQRYKLGGRDE